MTKKKNSEETLGPFAAPLPGDPESPNRPARGREVKIGLAVLALMLATVGYVVATQIFSADEAAEAVAEDGLGAEEDRWQCLRQSVHRSHSGGRSPKRRTTGQSPAVCPVEYRGERDQEGWGSRPADSVGPPHALAGGGNGIGRMECRHGR